MQISLNKVVPKFLEQEKIQSSGVWGKDLDFSKGSYFQVVASSGRGKSTLTHCIYGLRKDYDGNISISGTNIKSAGPEELSDLRQNKMSIIFQDLRLFPDHTVEENLGVKKELSSFPGAADISEMASRLGIANKLHQKAGLCSYGEQQRVAIIRALIQPYEFLIMDEPFSHLDNTNRKIALQLIMEETVKRNASIILLDLHPNHEFPGNQLNL